MPTTTTEVSRLKLLHPDFQHDGGSPLHTKVRTAWSKLGDNIGSRFFTTDGLADSASANYDHNFKCPFDELSTLLYARNTGTGELTRLSETTTPKRSEFTVQATSGSETTSVTVTNNSGASRDIAVVVNQIGSEGKATYSIANNQASAQSITGLLFSSTVHKAVQIHFDLHRQTDSLNLDEIGVLYLSYDPVNTLWRSTVDSNLDNAGVVFSVTASGQVQYTSSNMAGSSYEGSLRVGKIIYIDQ